MKKIIAVLLCLFTTTAFADQYQIIVDAGSSGSRLHLFQYDATQTVPVINDIFSESTKPGLSSFANNPQDAGASLKKLLDDATAQVKNKQINPHDVKISIQATAGMRLLPTDKQQAIYASVTQYLQQYEFTVDRVETIPGKMEAIYGWLDINYLAGHFQDHSATNGSIDMGGASTQIAFVTNDTSKPDDMVTLTVGGQQYAVFAKSFLGLGQDQSRDKMTTFSGAENCYPTGYTMNPSQTGNFNYMNCTPLYGKIIEDNHVMDQIVPIGKNIFTAYSGAYYTLNFLGADTNPTEANLYNRIMKVCTESWDQLKKDYPQVADKYLSTYCANGVYMKDLFFAAYNIRDNQMVVTNQINGKDIDWTLGALLFGLVH
jgi:apyrase